MALLGDLLACGPAALRLPGALRRRGCRLVADALPCAGRRRGATGLDDREPGRPAPVLLVHGYAGTPAVWDPLAAALRDAGAGPVARLAYNSLLADLSEATAAVLDAAADLAAASAADGGPEAVHLVGHSLGGLLVRAAALTDLRPVRVDTVVTIGSPHGGTPLASLALGPFAPLLRAGLPVPPPPRRPDATRWVAYFSDADPVVPTASARLVLPGRDVVNTCVPGSGHLTLCRDPRLLAGVVGHLTATADRAPVALPAAVPALPVAVPALVPAAGRGLPALVPAPRRPHLEPVAA